MPDFSAYRRESTMDSTKSSRDTESSRKLFSYMFTLGELNAYAMRDFRMQDPNFGEASRRLWENPSISSLGAGLSGAFLGKTVATEFVMSMAASADVLALAKIEVNLSEIPEGKNMTYKWRGKPLFIRHRTSDEIASGIIVDLKERWCARRDLFANSKGMVWMMVVSLHSDGQHISEASQGPFQSEFW